MGNCCSIVEEQKGQFQDNQKRKTIQNESSCNVFQQKSQYRSKLHGASSSKIQDNEGKCEPISSSIRHSHNSKLSSKNPEHEYQGKPSSSKLLLHKSPSQSKIGQHEADKQHQSSSQIFKQIPVYESKCSLPQSPQIQVKESKGIQNNLNNKEKWNRLLEVDGPTKKMGDLIGMITAQTSQGEKIISTGLLVTATIVITSADAVFSRLLTKFHTNISFYPSLNGELEQTITIQEIIIHDSFKNPDEPEPQKYNIALLKLNQCVYKDTFLKFKEVKDTIRANIYGYPKTQYENRIDDDSPQFYQIGGFGEILILGGIYCSYDMPEERGLSGSPIFTYDEETDTAYSIGIHIGRDSDQSMGKGLLFRRELLDRLIEWQYDLLGKTDLEQSCSYLKNEKASVVRTGIKITQHQHKGIRRSTFKSTFKS